MFLLARFGGSRRPIHWHDVAFVPLAAIVVYPDRVLDWIGARTGRHFTWVHVVLLIVVTLLVMVALDLFLLRICPRFDWWMPILVTGLMGVFRAACRVVEGMFSDGP